MYFYCFDNNHSINIYISQHKSNPGDIIFHGNKYYLNIGENISRSEQGSEIIHFEGESIIRGFCNTQTLELLHWMVNERFSSYNKCIPLFFGSDILITIKHRSTSLNTKKSIKFQSLIIFPSVFSLNQYYNNISMLNKNSGMLILTGQSTNVSRAKAYRSIHNNKSQILYCTHSKIFQNRDNLKKITIIDEYSQLYHTHQDPRYNIGKVVDKMKEIYKIT